MAPAIHSDPLSVAAGMGNYSNLQSPLSQPSEETVTALAEGKLQDGNVRHPVKPLDHTSMSQKGKVLDIVV